MANRRQTIIWTNGLVYQCVIAAFGVHDLTHWGRVMHICISKITIIGSDNGLSPDRRQAIIWTNAGLLLIGPLGTNFNEILIEILTFAFKKMRLKVSSAKRRPFCLGFNVLNEQRLSNVTNAHMRSCQHEQCAIYYHWFVDSFIGIQFTGSKHWRCRYTYVNYCSIVCHLEQSSRVITWTCV